MPTLPTTLSMLDTLYLANLVEAGLPPSVAERTADEAFAQSFPGGQPAAGHRVFCVEHGGEKAGLLWIGPQSTEQPDRWWVWDIVISKAFRGQGLGRQVMLLAEIEARARGAVELATECVRSQHRRGQLVSVARLRDDVHADA